MNSTGSKFPLNKVAKHIVTMPRSGIRDFFDIVSTRKDIISLGIGEPDFDTPWHIREATIQALEKGATHYTSNMGLLSLRRAIAGYIEKTFRVAYKPENEVLVTVGVSEALDLAVRALVEPGDEILYQEPCFVSYRPVIVMAGGVPVSVLTDSAGEFRLTREALEEKVTKKTKALLLNYPNNPTGATLDAKSVGEIAAFACEHDLIVITDEIYSELTYSGTHLSIAALPGMKDRTIFLHGFSKAWAMTGFRMGFACGPPELVEAMMKIHQYTMMCASTLSQEAALAALEQPEVDIGEMRKEYQQRRDFLYGAFKEIGLPCVKPRGAFYAFPYVGEFGLSSKEFALKLLDDEKVAAVPGSAFGPSGEGYLRCAYATSMADLEEAMTRLKRFTERLKKG